MPDHNLNVDSFQSYWDTKLENSLNFGSDGPGGAFVGYLSNYGTVYSNSFGKSSIANNVDFKTTTACGIRSVTKVITAALSARAEQSSPGFFASKIGDYEVITNNIARWENRFVPADARASGASARKPPVHLTATINEIATHTGNIWEIGKWRDQITGKWRACYSPARDYRRGGRWSDYESTDNLIALKNLMETLESVDDIVAMAGAVLSGIANPNSKPTPYFTYNDKAGWLEAACIEQVLGDSWFNLVKEQFASLGLSPASHPSQDGNQAYFKSGNDWLPFFKGHNANPVEIPGLAVAYNPGPATVENPLGLYLEPEQSQESGYAIGCSIMSAEDLNLWGRELRWPSGGGYLTTEVIQNMFTAQSGFADVTPSAGARWPGVNWGHGVQKMTSIPDINGNPIDTWGSIGQGGFGGYGGAIVWLAGRDPWNSVDSNLTVSAVTNLGMTVADAYAMAKDFAANFMLAKA
jgi:CubicO group peptidase (beta-lactamase class C family)